MSRDRILFIQQVQEIYPASKATIYRSMRAGLFPKQVACGTGRVGWRESEILAWLSSLRAPAKSGALPLPTGNI